MGICNPDLDPDGRHEGYLVGLVPATRPDGRCSDYRFRELSCEGGDDPGPRLMPLATVQMGCSCGWRSPVLDAPRGTEWIPFAVITPPAFEDRCHRLWHEHVELEALRLAETRGPFWRESLRTHGIDPPWDLAGLVKWLVGTKSRAGQRIVEVKVS